MGGSGIWTPLLWLVAAVAVGGLVLLCVALRGRLVARGLFCRRCRFDLSGLGLESGRETRTTPVTHCPECGSALAHKRGPRRTLRKTRRLMLAAAILLFLGSLALGGALIAQSGPKAWQYFPGWCLKLISRGPQNADAAKAIDELSRRLSLGKLTASETSALIDRALKFQSDPKSKWLDEWGGLVLVAIRRNSASGTQIEAFARLAKPLVLEVRDKARAGTPLPVGFTTLEGRTGRSLAGSDPWIEKTVIEVSLAGRPLELPKMNPTATPIEDFPPIAAGTRLSSSPCQIPFDQPPGECRLAAKVRCRLIPPFGRGSAMAEWTEELSATTTIVPPGIRLVEAVRDASLRQSVERSLFAGHVGVGAMAGGRAFQSEVSMKPTAPPIDLAFDIFLLVKEADGSTREIKLMPWVVRAGADMPWQANNYVVDAPPPTLPVVDLLLRPNLALAEGTPGMTRFWNREIFFRNVPIRGISRASLGNANQAWIAAEQTPAATSAVEHTEERTPAQQGG